MKIPYSPLAPDTSDLLRACEAVLRHHLSDRHRLDALASLSSIAREGDVVQQALIAWGVAAGLGHPVPQSYGTSPTAHREHVAEWPAECLTDALNAIIEEA